MKRKIFSILFVVAMVLALVATPAAAKETTFTISYNQAQFQCRAAWWGGPIADWTYVYQNYATSADFTLTGKSLHTSISYSPPVTNLQGASAVYTYDKTSGKWIQHEGTIQYTSPYSGLPITEYWRGYLEFDGTPSADTFVHGVGYQWGYVFGVDEETVKAYYTYAEWDSKVGAWLLGFSIYLWDSDTQAYDVTSPYDDPEFPYPFIEPVPASNYNPMGL